MAKVRAKQISISAAISSAAISSVGAVPSVYVISMPHRNDDIRIEAYESAPLNGPERKIRWAVVRGGMVWTKKNEWVFQPMPSSRDDEFLKLARYTSLTQAMRAAQRAKNETLVDPRSLSNKVQH